MLCGEFHHTLDSQNRVSVPATMRVELGNNFITVRDLRGKKCIRMYTTEKWMDQVRQIRDKMDGKSGDDTMWSLHRIAKEALVDQSGRIQLTKDLLGVASIEGEPNGKPRNVVIVGCGDFAEIWDEHIYEEYVGEIDENALLLAMENFRL